MNRLNKKTFVIAFLIGVLFTLSLAVPFIGTATQNSPRKFIHPGILHNKAELDFVKSRVQAGEEPWKSAWEQLCSHSVAQLSWVPNPTANVLRGTNNQPDIGASTLEKDASAAYAQALQWAITGDQRHADKVIEILNAYAVTLKSVGDHDAKLLVGMAGINFINAAELIRYSNAGWKSAYQDKFAEMLRNVLYPVIEDFYPTANGNWDAAMIQTMLSMGIYLDDHAMFQRAVDYYLRGEGNGAVLKYINDSGECQESGRDQAHTQMGLGYLGCAAEIAWNQGVDLYGAYDNRLALGFEYTAKYNLGFEVPYQSYQSVEGRYNYPSISGKSRGQFRCIYERIYHHYHDLMGLEMAFTKQVIDKNRPEPWHIQHAAWGTLMYAKLPVTLSQASSSITPFPYPQLSTTLAK